ncbi:MAG: DegT/DnrJ/EryC1/StrS aminotransferase family protein [Tardiphaga sp.]|nr:DegT/DnrJ/EryC1/StrS aminotransferase family protein [Tardiphaga sp.]
MSAYPTAVVPTQPVLSFSAFGARGRHHMPSVLDSGPAKFVTSGRVAIALALKEMQIGAGHTVLVPSYHCASMVEPVIWSGAKPLFYRIKADTSVDLDDVAAKLDPSVKVLMATNYFGFPQDLTTLRAFCDTHGLKLLEDCAHSFLGEHRGKPVGSFGDYAIASSMKFFPVYEGGCLVSSRHSLKGIRLSSAGVGFEAKSAFNALEKGFEYRRMGLVRALLAVPMALKNFIWGQVKTRGSSENNTLGPGASDGGFGFEEKWLHKRCSWFSRCVILTVSRARVGEQRRKNYRLLEDAVKGIPGCRPLYPTLPDGVFPWVFPLLTDNPQPIFSELKNAGVPVIRFGEFLWPGVDASVCANSVDLSKRVLQFACHQELRPAELEWMLAKIKASLINNQRQEAVVS